jgi:predicted RecB family nuclease
MDFSVNSLLSIEKKMKSEIARLMKATSVSSVADLNKKVLSDKLNKGPLSEYLNSFVKLLDSSLNLCKGAAGSLDEMKTKVMDTQSQLIEKKKEELATVNATVKTELKSWVDIVKKDNKQNRQLTAKSVKEAVKTVNLEEE